MIDEDFNPDKAWMHLEEYSSICENVPLCITIPCESYKKSSKEKSFLVIFFTMLQT
jgi:hypothetical protein